MKTLTALVAIFVLSLAAYAGPYFVIENEGLTLQPSLDVGWEFEAPFVNFTNLSISGDFFVTNDNLAAYPTPWIGGFALDFAFANDGGRDVFEIGLGMDVGLLPAPWPEYVELDTWTTTIAIAGYPSSIVTIYGAIDLAYDVTNPPGPGGWVGVWNFIPTIGLECRWP